MNKIDINNNENVGCYIFKLFIILEDESVFLSCVFKVRLRMPHVVEAKRRLRKTFECLKETITRLVKLN